MEPLRLEPRIEPRLWGGDRLARWLGLPEPLPDRIGEVWQVYDDNRIVDGRFAGRTLAQATHDLGEALVGTRAFSRYGSDFPLLLKFLETAQPLSVQVHPDDAYARENEPGTGYLGKNEAWYVIEAEPEANVVLGLVRPVRRDEFAAAVTSVALEALLRRLPVAAGDTVLVTAGTIHTIGPGILLYEIQQKSDLTYRVYDFDRADPATGQRRELHLAKALDVAELGPAPLPAPPVPVAEGRELLTSCPSFALERWSIQRPVEAATDDATLEILTVIDGSIRLRWNGPAIDLQRGATTVLPASLGRFALEGPADGGATLLRAYVPES